MTNDWRLLRPDLLEAYARRLMAVLSSELGVEVATIQQRTSIRSGEQAVEWKALLADGSAITLSATITAPERQALSGGLSRDELEELRELGISPGDVERG